MKKVLKHESGLIKEVKIGFSWTTLFFGLFVPLIRGDLKWALIMFGIALIVGVPTYGIGSFISNLVFAFIYNKLYVRDLLEKGYRPQNEEDVAIISNYTNG